MFKRPPEQEKGYQQLSDDNNQKQKLKLNSIGMSIPGRKDLKTMIKAGEEEEGEGEVKKLQERRAANRKAAFRSRQRRRQLAEELQNKVEALTKSCEELRRSGFELKSKYDLAILENQLLRNNLQKQYVTSNATGGATIMPNSALLTQATAPTAALPPAAIPPAAAALPVPLRSNVFGLGNANIGHHDLFMPSHLSPFLQSLTAAPTQASVPAPVSVPESVSSAHQVSIPGTTNSTVQTDEQRSLSDFYRNLISRSMSNNNEGSS